MSQGTPTKASPLKPTVIILIIVILAICACLVAAVILGGVFIWQRSPEVQQTGSPSDWGGALIVVYNLDKQDSGLSAYIYNLEESEIFLPEGHYYAEMKLADGTLMSFSPLIIVDEGKGVGAAAFKSRLSNSIQSQEIGQEIEQLVRFLIAVDNVRLTYFEIASNGFQNELFSTNVEPSWSDEEKLMGALNNLGDPQTVTAAAQAFISRAETSRAHQPGKAGLGAPAFGIIDKIISFFSLSSEENARAKQEVLAMYAAINEPWEKEDAFDALDESQRSGADNFDEFITKVENGEIQDMTGVRRNLMQLGPMSGIMQDLNPESNRPGGEIIHRVGAEAIKRGAELNVEVIKEVLTITFPGMDEGFGYADKVNEWAEYVQQIYNDPLAALGEELKGQAADLIKDRIKTQLQSLFPEMDQNDVDSIVEQITEQATESITNLVDEELEFDQPATEVVRIPAATEIIEKNKTPTVPPTEISPEPSQEPTEEGSDSGSGPVVPIEEIDLPDDLATQEIDENKGSNENFVWDGARACWNYVGPTIENYTWDCGNQCFRYQDKDWIYDCGSDCATYIGPDSQNWVWNCQTWCWEFLDPNFSYNCATGCLEYVGPDIGYWYYDCSRNCLEYIGPAVDGVTWSCAQHRWLVDE